MDEDDVVVCRTCGYVVRRPFDNTAEYRFFSSEDKGDPTRVGAPQDASLPNASLGTVILSGYGNTKNMYRVRMFHSWNTVPYKERSLIQTSERLSLIGLNHGINQSAIEATKNLYITLQDIGGRHGLSRDSILSACLYMALKQSGSPRKPKEIADIFGISSATFTKALKQMQELMAVARQKGKLSINSADNKAKSSSTRATEYIQLPLSRLPIPRTQLEHIRLLCTRVAEKADDSGLSQENMPPSLAAGCIAFVIKRCDSLDTISLTKIAEASEISIATLQKCLRRLESNAECLEECM
jgi:transcription initiation factor TFIIIB Brf1 subunit/transcription initiation factor TFIIB